MMKIKCEVIQDLLPLYCDDQASSDSRKLIEDHLQGCDRCRMICEEMKGADGDQTVSAEANLKELEPLKMIRRKNLISIFIAAIVAVLIAFGPFYWFFIRGEQVASDDVTVKVTASVDTEGDASFTDGETDAAPEKYYSVHLEFALKNGKCLDVRSNYMSRADGEEIVYTPYQQLRIPFDDRGKYPGEFSQGHSQDRPFTDRDVIIIRYKDKSVEYNLKTIAEEAGIQ